MDLRIQSDGQLYPPKPPLPPPPNRAPAPPPPPLAPKEGLQWEDFLLLAIGFAILKGEEKTDLPLLLALAYVLFDSCFSLKKLL